jgi:hypothetical protein
MTICEPVTYVAAGDAKNSASGPQHVRLAREPISDGFVADGRLIAHESSRR